MSEVITDKLTGRATAGDVTITSEGGSATMQLQQGLAKNFVNLDASSGTPTAQDSLNLSSITDTNTGRFAINVTNNYDNANYSLAGYSNGVTSNSFTGDNVLGLGTSLITTTTTAVYEMLCWKGGTGGTYVDSKHADSQGFGDLA